jgi:acyl-CoA reductase-like NAD-dependent aldehyde dehydrogenase
MRDEPFGPLALVNPVRNLDEAIEKANSLPYGLAAYAFTRSAQNADRLASEVEVGNLSITTSSLPSPRRRSAASRKATMAGRAAPKACSATPSQRTSRTR